MLRKLKIITTGISIGIVFAIWCHGVEFMVKSPTSSIDNIYWSYVASGFLFLTSMVLVILKFKPNPKNNTLFILSFLFMVISICFMLLYQPFFDCVRDDGTWVYAKGCSKKST